MTEHWKSIDGYEGLYEVSDLGNVRSLDRDIIAKNGRPYRRKGRILRPEKTKNGYLRVHLTKNGKQIKFTVHRLVARAFKNNPDNKKEVNHLNEIKTDNRVVNLVWCTSEENINYGSRNERAAKAQINNPKHSKPVEQLDLSGNYIRTFPSQSEARRQLNKKSNGPIGNVLTDRAKTGYGFKWRYA